VQKGKGRLIVLTSLCHRIDDITGGTECLFDKHGVMFIKKAFSIAEALISNV
jgi:hypothetical protein